MLEGPGHFLVLGVLGDKVKDRQVAPSIPDHRGVIPQLQEADIAMMILERFELEPGAVLHVELEPLVAAVVRRHVLLQPRPVVFENRCMAERPLAVRTPLGVHLE